MKNGYKVNLTILILFLSIFFPPSSAHITNVTVPNDFPNANVDVNGTNWYISNQSQFLTVASQEGWMTTSGIIRISNKILNNVTIRDIEYPIRFIDVKFTGSIYIDNSRYIEFHQSLFAFQLEIDNSENIKIEDNMFDAVEWTSIAVHGGSERVTIQNNDFTLKSTNHYIEFKAINAWESSDLKINGNEFTLMEFNSNPFEFNFIRFLIIENNTVNNLTNLNKFNSHFNWIYLLQIRNNYFEQAELNLNWNTNVTISNNEYTDSYVNMKDNHDAVVYTNQFDSSTLRLHTSNKVVVDGNTFSNTYSGVVLERSSDVNIINNHFENLDQGLSVSKDSDYNLDNNSFKNVDQRVKRHDWQLIWSFQIIGGFIVLIIILSIAYRVYKYNFKFSAV